MASICRFSSTSGFRSRSTRPRVTLRANFCAFSSLGFSRPTCFQHACLDSSTRCRQGQQPAPWFAVQGRFPYAAWLAQIGLCCRPTKIEAVISHC